MKPSAGLPPHLHHLTTVRNFATITKTGINGRRFVNQNSKAAATGHNGSPAIEPMFPNQITNPHATTAEIERILLPRFLLTNIQSFGYSVDTDKTSELQFTLTNNEIDIACITETWLSENTMDYISFQGYTSFHSIRNGVRRASGGVSILVNEDYSIKLLNDDAPNTIENLWVSICQKWLPRAISVIIVACI